MSLNGIKRALLRDVEVAEEAERRRRLEEEEASRRAVRLRIEMEERKRLERERTVREIQSEFRRRLGEARAKAFSEYFRYYTEYHRIRANVERLKQPLLDKGLSWIQAEGFMENVVRFASKDWPEPYRSRCEYSKDELLMFFIEPYQMKTYLRML